MCLTLESQEVSGTLHMRFGPLAVTPACDTTLSIKWREVTDAPEREIYELAVKLLLFASDCLGLCLLFKAALLLAFLRL